MKVYSTLFLLLCFLSFFQTGLKSAEESLRLDSPELRVEVLQAEIDRIQAELAELKSQPKSTDSARLLEEKKKRLTKCTSDKGQFERLNTEFLSIESELDQLQDRLASSDIQTEDQFEEIFAHRIEAESRKIELMKELCLFCDDLDQFGPQDLPFFLNGVNFSNENHMLSDETLKRYGCLSRKSLQEITGRRSDRDTVIRQLPVAQQSLEVGGSGSCAYHSLKNGIVLLHTFFCAVDSQQTVIQNLKSKELIKLLFGKHISPWRSIVIIERKKHLIKEFIRNILLYTLIAEKDKRSIIGNPGINANSYRPDSDCPDNKTYAAVHFFTDGQWLAFEPFSQALLDAGFEERIRSKFIAILAKRFVEFVNELPIDAEQSAPIEITGEMLMRELFRLIDNAGDIYKELHNIELIKKYFPKCEKISIIISKGIEERRLFKVQFREDIYEYYIHCGLRGEGYGGVAGAWAAKEQIQPILANEKKSGLLRILFDKEAPILTFFMGDAAQDENGRITLEGELVFKVGQTTSYAEGFEEIKDTLANPESSCAICILTHLPGHWITLVINKVGPIKQYFVADSASTNGKTINDAALKLLIRLLEGVDEPVAAPLKDTGKSFLRLIEGVAEPVAAPLKDTGESMFRLIEGVDHLPAEDRNESLIENNIPEQNETPPAGWGCIIS